jgi:hypothetical protein
MFYLLKEGHPMIDYETFKDLFCFIEFKNMLRNHWSNNLGWDMAKNMHVVVLQCMK